MEQQKFNIIDFMKGFRGYVSKKIHHDHIEEHEATGFETAGFDIICSSSPPALTENLLMWYMEEYALKTGVNTRRTTNYDSLKIAADGKLYDTKFHIGNYGTSSYVIEICATPSLFSV